MKNLKTAVSKTGLKLELLAIIAIVGVCLGLASCQSSKKADETPVTPVEIAQKNAAEKNQAWALQMRALGADLSDLLPLAFDSNAFRDKKNEALITEKLNSLDKIAKDIQHSPMQAMTDPSLNFISYDFKEQVKQVRESFMEGKKDYARYELVKTSNFCIECHTRNSSGPAFGADNLNSRVLQLDPLERAEYYTATRAFDKALEIYMNYFKQKLQNKGTALQTEKAALQALVITVRFQNDSAKSLQLAQAIENSPHAPYYLKIAAQAWQKDIEVWKKDTGTGKKKATPAAKIDLKREKQWIEKSQTRRFEQGALGGEVYALRAIASLNSELPQIKGKDSRAEAFYLMGQSYLASVFSEHTNIGEKYLESCIRSFPKTVWSKKCYQKYEEVIYSNYTGSAGTFLPVDEENKLQELFKMVE